MYEMVLMNSWNFEQYGASVGDEFDSKMNHIKCFMNFWYI